MPEMIYITHAMEAMHTKDSNDPSPESARMVYVNHLPDPTVAHDACPGESTEDVFEELGWEMLMAEARRYAP